MKWDFQLDTLGRKALVGTLVLAVSALVASHAWGPFMAAWITRSREPDPSLYERAIAYDAESADYRFTLAQIYHYSTAELDFEIAREHYQSAIELNPRRSTYWMEFSKFLEERTEPEEARLAMDRALETDPNDARVRWAAANLYIRLADLEQADLELRRSADLDPAYVAPVLDLVWRFYEDPELILETHIPDTRDANLTALRFFVRQTSEAGAALAWRRLSRFETQPIERFGYVDYLVNLGQAQTAYEVFLARSDQSEAAPAFYNGNFELELLNGGFDWRYSTGPAEVRLDTTESREGFQSLLIQFNGEENVSFSHVQHWLPVRTSQSYELSFWMRTEVISTDEGVYIEVGESRTDSVIGTTFWRQFTLPFEASSDMATVRVRRNPSQKLDNRISGRVWLDDFQLRETE